MSADTFDQTSAQFGAAIDAAIAGRDTVILRQGKPVARVVPFAPVPVDLSVFDPYRGTLPEGFRFDRDALNS